MRAISGTSGSSGFGSHNREQMDKRTAERRKDETNIFTPKSFNITALIQRNLLSKPEDKSKDGFEDY